MRIMIFFISYLSHSRSFWNLLSVYTSIYQYSEIPFSWVFNGIYR